MTTTTTKRFCPQCGKEAVPSDRYCQGCGAQFGAAPNGKSVATDTYALAVVLDESGSMSSCWDATISGYNEYMRDAKKDGHDYRVYVTKFDTEYTPLHKGDAIATLPDLDKTTYTPRGMTALHDAICKTISEVDSLGTDKVMFVIVTDGGENSSKEHSLADVKRLIDERTKRGWAFAFLGANIDAYGVGGSMGISASNTSSYNSTPVGTRAAFATASASTVTYSASGGMQNTNLISDKDREDLKKKK